MTRNHENENGSAPDPLGAQDLMISAIDLMRAADHTYYPHLADDLALDDINPQTEHVQMNQFTAFSIPAQQIAKGLAIGEYTGQGSSSYVLIKPEGNLMYIEIHCKNGAQDLERDRQLKQGDRLLLDNGSFHRILFPAGSTEPDNLPSDIVVTRTENRVYVFRLDGRGGELPPPDVFRPATIVKNK